MFDFFKKLFSQEGKEKDPVCGMSVDPETALHAAYERKQYYFCSENCKEEYRKQLAKEQSQRSHGGGCH